MHPSYYSSIVLNQTSLSDARRLYVAWVVGAAPFARIRSKRADVGVDVSWPMRELHAGASFHGLHDARIDTRNAPGRFLLNLVHRDSSEPAVLWHNVAEIMALGRGVRVRHAVARTAPPGYELPPATGAPGVVRKLLEANGPDIAPVELAGAELIRLDADAAEHVVAHLIATQSREIPIVVVTRRNDADNACIVSPETVASRLSGMARVVLTTDLAADVAMLNALQRRGFTTMFGVSDGAVRLFLPSLAPTDSPFRHRLWTTDRLASLQEDPATVISGEIAEAAVRGTIPVGFMRLVSEFDVTEFRARVDRVLAQVPQAPVGVADVERLQQERELLRLELAEASQQIASLSEKLKQEQETNYAEVLDLDAIENERNQLREELFRETQKGKALQTAIDAMPQAGSGANLSSVARDAVLSAIQQTPTPAQCLILLELFYPERVVVLPSAHKSARGSADFANGSELWHLLQLLVDDYWSQMSKGGVGDTVARGVFGKKKFAAQESETASNNRDAQHARTFEFEGERYTMLKHLKIGVADTTVESIRVHFEWLADKGIVLIGHCGAHLYLPGH